MPICTLQRWVWQSAFRTSFSNALVLHLFTVRIFKSFLNPGNIWGSKPAAVSLHTQTASFALGGCVPGNVSGATGKLATLTLKEEVLVSSFRNVLQEGFQRKAPLLEHPLYEFFL